MKNKNLPYILIAVIIIAGFIFAGIQIIRSSTLFQQPASIQTTGWKSFTNAKYGISFSYPPEWKLADISDNSSTTAYGFELISLQSGNSPEPLGERVMDEYDRTHKIHRFEIKIPLKKYDSLLAYLKDNGGGVPGISNDYAKIESVVLGNTNAQKYTDTAETNKNLWHHEVYLILMPKSQTIFEISSSYTHLARSEKSLHDQIISSLKFTD